MQDIHPIKAPVMIGMDPELVTLLLLIAGGLILLILVIYMIRRFWKSRSKNEKNKLIPAIPPYALAIRELDSLCQKPGMDPKGFYFELGGLIKRYIGSSYAMNAVEMTTQELSKYIRSTRMDHGLVQAVAQFLIVSDPFRYGPMVPDSSRVKEDLASVRQLIIGMEADLESKRSRAKPLEEERP
jgi:hypothetical protein